MSDPTENDVCFHQGCPVCGRGLRIRVLLLGRRVYCQHCGGGFIASDASGSRKHRLQDSLVEDLIEKAEVMLQRMARGEE
jgi:hypothetical protein